MPEILSPKQNFTMLKIKHTLIAIPLLALILVACGNHSGDVSQSDVDEFAERASLVIPASAVATDFKNIFSMDGMIFLQLNLPAADLTTFLYDSGLDGVLYNETDTGPGMAIFGDLLAEHPTKFRQGQKNLGEGFFLDVLTDEDQEASVVYLIWFGT